MPSTNKTDSSVNDTSKESLNILNSNLKQLEFINQLEFHLNAKNGYCKTILSELDQIKTFTQKNTIKVLKEIKNNGE